jgi:tetratricopeptide (TPR) repeat protein
MAFSGDLRNISLADVFQNLAGNRVTGTLQVQWKSNEHFVRFEKGLVTGYSTGFGKGLPFPEFLRQRGFVADKKLEKALEKRGRSRKPLSQVLIESKLLSDDDVAVVVQTMIEEFVWDLMLVREAKFQLTEGAPPSRTFDADQRRADVQLDVGPLVMEGARRADEWERIRKVVGSDHDLVVLLEGWEECGLDEFGVEVAATLDGQTPIRKVLELIPASRFDVLKVVSDLVLAGGARLATGEEIREEVQNALASKRHDDAESLLRRALELERNDIELHRELAELLAQRGRPKEAASEYATIGWGIARDDRPLDALPWYDLAIEHDPEDLGLREQRLELVTRFGEPASIAAATFELVDVLLAMGLADRARGAILGSLEHPELERDFGLLEKLAEVEARLGDTKSASTRYAELSGRVLPHDEKRALELLREAHALRPDDASLGERITDIETGRRMRRERARRRFAAIAAMLAVSVAFGTAGIAEFLAARRIQAAFEQTLAAQQQPEAGLEALASLNEAHEQFPWTLAGQRAASLGERVIQTQVERARELLETGRRTAGESILVGLEEVVGDSELRGAVDELLARVAAEEEIERLIVQTREGDPTAVEALRNVIAPRAIDLLVRELGRAETRTLRLALLQAICNVDAPECTTTLARLYLASDDLRVRETIEGWFARHRDLKSPVPLGRVRDLMLPVLEGADRGDALVRERATRLQQLVGS